MNSKENILALIKRIKELEKENILL